MMIGTLGTLSTKYFMLRKNDLEPRLKTKTKSCLPRPFHTSKREEKRREREKEKREEEGEEEGRTRKEEEEEDPRACVQTVLARP